MLAGRVGTARAGILTIIDEEFDAVRSMLGGPGRVVEVADSSYYSPNPATCDVVLAQSTDRSNIPASNATFNMLEDFRPEVIIVCGIAGAFDGRDLDLGHVLVADYLHYCEFWKLTEGGDFRRYLPIQQPAPCSGPGMPVRWHATSTSDSLRRHRPPAGLPRARDGHREFVRVRSSPARR